MPAGRWIDRSQPQTLQIATMLLYINAAFGVIDLIFGAVLPVILILQASPAYAIANEKKWGYWLAVGLSVLNVASAVVSPVSIINLVFEVALVALLLHPQSRRYKSVWFK
jgi:hypothetical protein